MRNKVRIPTIREEITLPISKCLAKGDFGYKNLHGTPYLCFGVRCERPKSHTGKHACLHEVCITPSYEPNGLNVVRKSVEVQGDLPLILWQNTNDTTICSRNGCKNIVTTLHKTCLGCRQAAMARLNNLTRTHKCVRCMKALDRSGVLCSACAQKMRVASQQRYSARK